MRYTGAANMLRGQKRTPADFIKIVSDLHPELDFSITEYKNARSPVKFRCKEHGEQEIQANGLLHGRGCPKCGRRRSAEASLVPMTKALSQDEKDARAAHARAARTADSFQKLSDSQSARWSTDEAGKAAQSERGKRIAAAKWAGMTPEQRKEAMAAVRAGKQHPNSNQ